MSDTPIALQLYSVREDCAKDLPGVLQKVAAMGYKGVEFAGFYDYSAAEIKKMLGDNGLAVAGSHTGLNLLRGDEFEKTATFNKELGNPYVVVPYIKKEEMETVDGCKKVADELNAIAEKLAPMGMRTGYHNHNHEFAEIDGHTIWEHLFGNLRADVIMQVDTGNALHGGADVTPYIRQYPGRATTVHLKEYSADKEKVVVGEGDMDWPAFFRACRENGGTEWYIVEQESYAHPPMECVKLCLDNLKGMGL